MMTIKFDNALGIHPQALMLREKRGEVLAANLANADTPHFKARDLDFKSVLSSARGSARQNLTRTRPGHLTPDMQMMGASIKYREPYNASLDGNTVEAQVEQARYAQNAVQYQASLRFINGRFAGLMTAIRGE